MQAIISTANREGLIELARELQTLKVTIFSTGGTARYLQDAQIEEPIPPHVMVSSISGTVAKVRYFLWLLMDSLLVSCVRDRVLRPCTFATWRTVPHRI